MSAPIIISTTIEVDGIQYVIPGAYCPSKIVIAGYKYRSALELIEEWIDHCCDVGPGLSATPSELWASFDIYSNNRENNNGVTGSISLGKRLKNRFPSLRDNKGNRIRLGIAIKDFFFDDLTDKGLF